jgi:hypothetical protein
MLIYKTQKGDEIITTSTLSEIQKYGTEYTSEEVSDFVPTALARSIEEKIEFGNSIKLDFLKDNEQAHVDTATSIAMLQAFAVISEACANGAITTLKYLVEQSTVNAIYTQERKTKYLEKINDFLNGSL